MGWSVQESSKISRRFGKKLMFYLKNLRGKPAQKHREKDSLPRWDRPHTTDVSAIITLVIKILGIVYFEPKKYRYHKFVEYF